MSRATKVHDPFHGLALLEAIAFYDPADLCDGRGRFLRYCDLPPRVAAALETVECDADGRIVSFRYKDKMAALDRLWDIVTRIEGRGA